MKETREEVELTDPQKTEAEGNTGSLEELFEQIEEILGQMEQPDVALEDAFSLYEQGIKKIRVCHEKMDLVEKKMRMIAEDGSEIPIDLV